MQLQAARDVYALQPRIAEMEAQSPKQQCGRQEEQGHALPPDRRARPCGVLDAISAPDQGPVGKKRGQTQPKAEASSYQPTPRPGALLQ